MRLSRMAFWGAVAAGLTVAGLLWQPFFEASGAAPLHPLANGLKLVIAFVLGRLVTEFHTASVPVRERSASLEQAQVLLCVSGALMMIIVGDSLARAFGIAGAASLVRFRTPVDDPRDAIILFLSLGLGMACGLGAVSTAGMGAAFLAVALLYLNRRPADRRLRKFVVSVTGSEAEETERRAGQVLGSAGVVFEPRERTAHEGSVRMRFAVRVPDVESLHSLAARLEESGLAPVSWEKGGKSR